MAAILVFAGLALALVLQLPNLRKEVDTYAKDA